MSFWLAESYAATTSQLTVYRKGDKQWVTLTDNGENQKDRSNQTSLRRSSWQEPKRQRFYALPFLLVGFYVLPDSGLKKEDFTTLFTK